MTKTEYFDRNAAVKKLIEITKMCDHNNDGKLSCRIQFILFIYLFISLL